MRHLLGALSIVALLFGVRELYRTWEEIHNKHKHRTEQTTDEPGPATPAQPALAADGLPALPPALQTSLEAARRQGADGLKAWLDLNRPLVTDPRLAAIELDYVMALAGKDFGRAREVFAEVKRRTPTNSPVYPRLKKLERTYE